MAAGCSDHKIRIYDLSLRKLIFTFDEHYDWVLTLDFSPNDNFLASGGGDQQIRIYNF